MDAARREKHRFGGAMRQAGIVAAAGVYALDHNVERLAEDHARARTLAEAWVAGGVPVELERVQSNFVQVDVAAAGLGEYEALELLAKRGVALSRTMRPGVLRAVTHLDLTDDDVAEAAAIVPVALSPHVRV
jgi:threonine aldolase